MVWLKNGAELPDCGDFRQLALGDGRFALRMPDMFPEDAATYSCEAFNGHGEARSHGTVTVLGKKGAKTNTRKKENKKPLCPLTGCVLRYSSGGSNAIHYGAVTGLLAVMGAA